MRTHQALVSSVIGLAALALAACSGEAGADGKSSSTSLVQVAAGAECAAGGTRVLVGSDDDGNGTIDPAEAKSSQLVCNGAAGANGADGAKGANGADGAKGANGTNADGGVLAKPNPVVNAYDGSGIAIVPAGTTALSATLSAPGPGKIIAISSMDAYCYAGGNEFLCASAGGSTGYYTLSTNAAAAPNTGSYDYFLLKPDETESTSRTAVFDVAAAGDVTVHIRASGAYGLWRRSLTLVFVPS